MNVDFIVIDRIQKIISIIEKYGEENFYICFSGGRDSCLLSWLIDKAIPNNNIPRIFVNTGIEYKIVLEFVKNILCMDNRFYIINSNVNIHNMLEEYGYPFKSKRHSRYLEEYQNNKDTVWLKYYNGTLWKNKANNCPNILKYQFENGLNFKCSSKCCDKLKKDPLKKWAIDHQKKYYITGITSDEQGQRIKSKCLVYNGDKLKAFQPLSVLKYDDITKIIEQYNIDIPNIYKYPYYYKRTGCKGCPFSKELQKELDTMALYFPNEKKQCEIIWKKVYDEYRSIGYRLKKRDENQLAFEDCI